MAADEKETRREMLSKAWDEHEKEDEPISGDHGAVGKDIADPETPVIGKHESAKPAENVDDSPTKPEVDKKPEDPLKKEAEAAKDLEKRTPAPVTDRAPNSWKPAIREHWGKLPPEVRAEVNRRELEIQQTLSQTAQVRKFANDFAQTIQPYSHLIRSQNSTPLQAVNNLMQTAAGLLQGNMEQRARIVSDIIANYGVDIKILDQVLSSGGYNPNQQAQVQAVPQWAKPLFGFMENVQTLQQQRQHQMQQEAEQAIQALEAKPFFDDVREDMADLMEAAANRGRVLSMEQAYEKAIALNPEIAKVIEQRKLAERNRNPVSEAAATLARARKAASTVKGSPAGTKVGVPSGTKLSRRQQLSEAWDNASE